MALPKSRRAASVALLVSEAAASGESGTAPTMSDVESLPPVSASSIASSPTASVFTRHFHGDNHGARKHRTLAAASAAILKRGLAGDD